MDSSSLSSSPDESAISEAMTLAGKARQLDARGSHYEAERFFHRALELIDPSVPTSHATLASIWNSLGELYLHMGRFDEAEQWFTKSLDISGSIRDLKEISTSRENLARVQRAQSELLKAKALKMMGAPDDMRCGNYSCCRGLLRTTDLCICGGCKAAFYCSHSCQKDDYERHKRYCQHEMS
ncbi:hypothetical protein L226DRAFT_31589 [Lentinus tigrinus ALCF2SS1-7]|uniref:MYND-type domain-containing protein n=1 Tax=Lentinus tigrinus ALCF2SS1-6 TaxID=1328759 RepID=A0A5C2SI86_9APHY|nr:hypothetical protein L227DRAFT_651263 [Lentinus tigrinus ALCF2SS1-6]RPD82589.1 hypothetical protein L226DRAFT_31589 [Lentinus tigrinus ALCF2SS1-7]